MSFRILLWFLLLVATFGGEYALGLSRYGAFNRAGLFGSNGRIDAGRKFGVEVGNDYRSAQTKFRSLGFIQIDMAKSQSCHGYDYPIHEVPHLWFDDSWRKGTLCIVSSNNRIKYLSWSYGFGFP